MSVESCVIKIIQAFFNYDYLNRQQKKFSSNFNNPLPFQMLPSLFSFNVLKSCLIFYLQKTLAHFPFLTHLLKTKPKKHCCSLKSMHQHFIRCCLNNDFFQLKSRSVFHKPNKLFYMPRLVLKHLKQCLTSL